jgi:lipopolysaccharide biosynthesis glycosyltransferase
MTYLTLMTNDAYIKGIVSLAYSLLAVDSKYNLLILHSHIPSVESQAILNKITNTHLRRVEKIQPKNNIDLKYALPQFRDVWTKLNIFKLTEYKRVILIDADSLVLRNIDELFEINLDNKKIAACSDCLCNPFKYKTFPEFHSEKYCFYNGGEKFYFNAGLLVVESDANIFEKLITALNSWDLSNNLFAEQDLLNEFFKNKWKRLDYVYNALQGLRFTHPKCGRLMTLKISTLREKNRGIL